MSIGRKNQARCWGAWKAGQVLLPVTPDEWWVLHQSSGNPFHNTNVDSQTLLWAIALRE